MTSRVTTVSTGISLMTVSPQAASTAPPATPSSPALATRSRFRRVIMRFPDSDISIFLSTLSLPLVIARLSQLA